MIKPEIMMLMNSGVSRAKTLTKIQVEGMLAKEKLAQKKQMNESQIVMQ